MGKIDINNEEAILKNCDFDYFYNSKECSRELCMFFNDIPKNDNFDKRQALIDLGRIAITLNEQDEKIKELENQVNKWKQDYEYCSRLERQISQEHQYCLNNWRECEKQNEQLKTRLDKTISDCNNLFVENQQLQQVQNQKAIEVLQKVKRWANSLDEYCYIFRFASMEYREKFNKKLDTQISELRGEK